MRTLQAQSPTKIVSYAAPVEREDALTEGDWERAYTLACREEVVRYLATPTPPSRTRKRTRTPSA